MTRVQIEVGAFVAILGTLLNYLLGDWDEAFRSLLICIAVDYLTGLSAAWYNGELNSCKGWKGIVKKVMMLILVVLANQLDCLFNSTGAIRTMVIYFLIGNEGLSILENLAAMGVPMPPILKEKLEQLKNEKGAKQNEKG